MEQCLKPVDKERVQYKSTVTHVWEYLDRAYLHPDTFLHDLIKPVNAARDISDRIYQTLEEFLDLLIRTFDIAEDAGMLPIVLHQNNLQPIYERWPSGEQARW